jgi:hypothetical protein
MMALVAMLESHDLRSSIGWLETSLREGGAVGGIQRDRERRRVDETTALVATLDNHGLMSAGRLETSLREGGVAPWRLEGLGRVRNLTKCDVLGLGNRNRNRNRRLQVF